MGISEIDYSEFYAPAFSDPAEARKFVEDAENFKDQDPLPARIIHQAARMLWLADKMDDIAPERPALQVLFFLIAAEAVAKMVFGFSGQGKSREYVGKFFEEICDESHRQRLGAAYKRILPSSNFRRHSDLRVTREEAVNFLYDVRCDVVHEGQYFMTMPLKTSADSHLNAIVTVWDTKNQKEPEFGLSVFMTAAELRQIVLKGAVNGCRKAMKNRA
jgi:hypothetical protein